MVDCTREDAESWCVMGPLPFAVAEDLGGEYGLATSDFNHENHNANTLSEANVAYGLPSDSSLARRFQIGFRATF